MILTCLGWMSALVFAQDIQFPVEKYKLANGLTVLLAEDHSSPSFTFAQWFRVGSSYERPGHTGLAHFFEHMMFKGTKKFPGDQLDPVIKQNGGSFDAFTTYDYTGFSMSFPAGHLELPIQIESDRMRNLLFDPNDVKNEREVVKEELRLTMQDQTEGLLTEALHKTVYKVHSYRSPIAGSIEELNRASIDDLKTFYNTYYVPNNAIVVIVGDFDKVDAQKLIEKYYAPLPSQMIPAVVMTPEPEQTAPRSFAITKPVQAITFAVAFPTTPAGDSDSYALDLLANILGEGSSSRLYKKLVYKTQLATAAEAGSWTPRFLGLFETMVSLKPGVKLASALNAVMAEFKLSRDSLVTDAELQKAKNQIAVGYINSLKTNAGRAQALEINEIIFNDYRQVFLDLNRYNQVTKEQIQEVAKKYLIAKHRSLVQVTPLVTGVHE